MSYLNLSSSVKGFNGSQLKPSWVDIEESLSRLTKSDGSIGLSVIDAPDIGPDSLEVRAEKQKYLVTMLDNITEDDDEVRTLFFKEKKGLPQIDILGDYWDPQLVTDDLDLVISIFKEFYETGNVSQDILSA